MLSENIYTNLVIDEPGTTLCMSFENHQLQSILKLFWEEESPGVNTDDDCTLSFNEFLHGMKFKENRYHVNHPWSHDKQEFRSLQFVLQSTEDLTG